MATFLRRTLEKRVWQVDQIVRRIRVCRLPGASQADPLESDFPVIARLARFAAELEPRRK